MRARQQLLLAMAFVVLLLFGLILISSRQHAVSQSMPAPLPVERARDVSPTVDRTLPATVRAPEDSSEAMTYVRANRERAEAGDDRARYRIGLIAQRCAAVYANYLTDGDLDLEGQWWTACGSFQADTLDGIDGHDWIKQAVAAKDPLAVLETTHINFMTGRADREELDRAIDLVEQSGDAEALAMLDQVAANLPEVP